VLYRLDYGDIEHTRGKTAKIRHSDVCTETVIFFFETHAES